MSLSEREYRQAEESGKAARRGGKRIGDVPYRGRTEKVRKLSDAWCNGWMAQDEEIKSRLKAQA